MIIKNNNKQYKLEYRPEYILYKTESLIKTRNNIYYTTIEISHKAKQYANGTSIENLYLKPILRAILEMSK
jgi:DNA-directed RNA polymerase subunit K/omega